MIEEYRFGKITIGGKTYTNDVEVRWTGEVLDWWREESHIIALGDIKRALSQSPKVIVLGTGASGIAKVTERAKEEIEKRGIKLIIDKTGEAVKTFNIIHPVKSFTESKRKSKILFDGVNEASAEEEGEQTKVIGLFHLTC